MDTRDIVDIFNRFDISSIKDESKYKISTLGSITNLNYKVEIGDKKFVLRVPGENPDLITEYLKDIMKNSFRVSGYHCH